MILHLRCQYYFILCIQYVTAHPSCIRITQTIPKNTEETQILWIEEWTNADDFSKTMQMLFKEYPKLSQVNEYLTYNPIVMVSRMITSRDYS